MIAIVVVLAVSAFLLGAAWAFDRVARDLKPKGRA